MLWICLKLWGFSLRGVVFPRIYRWSPRCIIFLDTVSMYFSDDDDVVIQAWLPANLRTSANEPHRSKSWQRLWPVPSLSRWAKARPHWKRRLIATLRASSHYCYYYCRTRQDAVYVGYLSTDAGVCVRVTCVARNLSVLRFSCQLKKLICRMLSRGSMLKWNYFKEFLGMHGTASKMK